MSMGRWRCTLHEAVCDLGQFLMGQVEDEYEVVNGPWFRSLSYRGQQMSLESYEQACRLYTSHVETCGCLGANTWQNGR